MSEPIHHHYIPVFYLRHWCGTDGKLVRFWRPHQEVVASRISPEHTAYEPYLYTLDGYPPDQQQAIEKHFMGPAVDGPGSEAFRVLIGRDNSKLTPELRSAWTRFLMAIRVRNPETVARIGKMARQLLERNLLLDLDEYRARKGADDPPTPVEWMEKHAAPILNTFGKQMLPDLSQLRGIGETIIRMNWSTFDLSASKVDLLTSDRPFIATHGLADSRCIIAFPLSPQLAFIATHDRAIERELLRHSVTKIAKALNAQVVQQAVMNVYGSSASHLHFIENMLRPYGLARETASAV